MRDLLADVIDVIADNLQGSTKAFIGLILLEDIPDTS